MMFLFSLIRGTNFILLSIFECKIALVTSISKGASPLHSLLSRFFPSTFKQKLRCDVRAPGKHFGHERVVMPLSVLHKQYACMEKLLQMDVGPLQKLYFL